MQQLLRVIIIFSTFVFHFVTASKAPQPPNVSGYNRERQPANHQKISSSLSSYESQRSANDLGLTLHQPGYICNTEFYNIAYLYYTLTKALEALDDPSNWSNRFLTNYSYDPCSPDHFCYQWPIDAPYEGLVQGRLYRHFIIINQQRQMKAILNRIYPSPDSYVHCTPFMGGFSGNEILPVPPSVNVQLAGNIPAQIIILNRRIQRI